MIPPYVVSNRFIAYLYFDIVITNIPSLMHLVLVMCDASIVTVLICLKVNSCQIIQKTPSTCTLEFEMKGIISGNVSM